ncbi:MAG TPA: helix-turn-helix transcriptional regulator [Phenylobacterium sp.]|jgi:transcriptional regulator with XRE-family HTH domain|nr:helix-turn-helix transcriptional regulator [Phenylobacterium sp.]
MPKSAAPDAQTIVADFLIELRRARGVSQVELARRMQTTQQFVSKVETRERRLDLGQFHELVRALGADPEAAAVEVFRRLREASAS